MPSWFFKTLRPGDTTREPIQGEFFSTEAITDNAEALVLKKLLHAVGEAASRRHHRVTSPPCLLVKIARSDAIQGAASPSRR
jgi:hypothetical protein